MRRQTAGYYPLIDHQGNSTVQGTLTVENNFTVNGRVISSNSDDTTIYALVTDAGTGRSVGINGVNTFGNDNSDTIPVTTDTSGVGTSNPPDIISPANASAASIRYRAQLTGTCGAYTGFVIDTHRALSKGTTYPFSYIIEQ